MTQEPWNKGRRKISEGFRKLLLRVQPDLEDALADVQDALESGHTYPDQMISKIEAVILTLSSVDTELERAHFMGEQP